VKVLSRHGVSSLEKRLAPISTNRPRSGEFILSPEWHGMALPAIKNFFLYATKGAPTGSQNPACLGHRGSSTSGIGGAYPISELRASATRNCRLCCLIRRGHSNRCASEQSLLMEHATTRSRRMTSPSWRPYGLHAWIFLSSRAAYRHRRTLKPLCATSLVAFHPRLPTTRMYSFWPARAFRPRSTWASPSARLIGAGRRRSCWQAATSS